MRARLWKLGLILSLSAGALLGVGFLVYLFRQFTRPDIHRVGGTILVYETDPDVSPDAFSPQELASAIKRRIDPYDSAGIEVRPWGDARIEISIPRSTSDHFEQVQQVKDLLSLMGKLEFRILANTRDDKKAIDLARKYFENAKKDLKIKAELEDRALKGKPPAAPDGKFTVRLHDYTGTYSYKWVEVGRQYRPDLGLTNPPQGTESSPLWQAVAKARENGETYQLGDNLLYSRDVANPSRAPAKDRDKKYEYFIVTRDPEDRSKEVTGNFLNNATETQDRAMRMAVSFHFNTEGGNRFRHLTSINVSEGKEDEDTPGFKRQLAIILDDQIVSAPRINAVISTDGVIEGNFTKAEVDRLVNILRSGALPATLKPQPVSETSVEPQK